jgi:hypothetical protein
MPPNAITVLFSVIGQAIVVGLLLLETVRLSAALYGRGKLISFSLT